MIKRLPYAFLFIALFLFTQCKREPLTVEKKITHLSDYKSNDGVISINIKGGKKPYAVKWSNYESDTVLKNLTAGNYQVTVVDSKGNRLIDTIQLNEPKWPVCIDIEDNNYKTRIFGEQTWMVENLRATKLPDGTPIESFVYNNADSNEANYGRLYTWHQAMGSSTEEGVQGVCPDGWHIPTDEEWSVLIDNISNVDDEIPNIKKHLELSYAGFYNNGFHGLESSVSFWTSTEAHNNAWKRYFNKNLSKAFKYHENKQNAISIRCIKN